MYQLSGMSVILSDSDDLQCIPKTVISRVHISS